MGEAQKLSPEEQIRSAREGFDAGKDFTVAVEEEFAILDPRSLGLVNRFEDFQAAAQGTEVEEHLVGELIASEVEVRTGRCETFADAAAVMVERRRQLLELAGQLDLALCATGTHPWSPWQEQRIIDTPHYRRNDEVLRYVVWRNNTFGLHVHVGIKGADRAILVTNALRGFLPDCSPTRAARRSSKASSRTCTPRGRRSSRACSRAAACRTRFATGPSTRTTSASSTALASITEHTQLWWSVRPHLAFPTVELRICDGQPELGESQALAAFMYALTARIARAIDEGEELPDHPHRLIEENLWRAIRHGLSGELIDLRSGDVMPARARIEQLLQWTMPVAEELGVASFLTVPAATPAERQIAKHEAGQSMEEIYAEEVLEAVHV